MKIGIIAPFDVLSVSSGASNRVFNLAKNLSDCGALIYVLHHGPTKVFNVRFHFLHFSPLDIFPGSSNYLHPLNVAYPFSLQCFLKQFKPDIIQCEQPWSMFPTLFFARNLGIPCVLDEHNVEYEWGMSASRLPFLAPVNFTLERIASSNSSLVLATSDVDKNRLVQMYNLSSAKIFVVPNGVDTQRFSTISYTKSQLKKKLGLSSKTKIVFFHGLMNARQNCEAASLIIDFIAPQVSDAIFIIAGKYSPRWLNDKAARQKNVILLGFVPKVEEYIVASDVCIVPVQTGSGTRLKLLEYLAAGKPIVSTVIGAEGIPLKSGVNAILLDKVDSSFVNSVRYLLSNEVVAEELGAAAKRFSEKFSWERIGKSLYDFYDRAFSEKA